MTSKATSKINPSNSRRRTTKSGLHNSTISSHRTRASSNSSRSRTRTTSSSSVPSNSRTRITSRSKFSSNRSRTKTTKSSNTPSSNRSRTRTTNNNNAPSSNRSKTRTTNSSNAPSSNSARSALKSSSVLSRPPFKVIAPGTGSPITAGGNSAAATTATVSLTTGTVVTLDHSITSESTISPSWSMVDSRASSTRVIGLHFSTHGLKTGRMTGTTTTMSTSITETTASTCTDRKSVV